MLGKRPQLPHTLTPAPSSALHSLTQRPNNLTHASKTNAGCLYVIIECYYELLFALYLLLVLCNHIFKQSQTPTYSFYKTIC